MNEPSDDRAKLYTDLHQRQLSEEESQNRHSAQQILKILFQHVQPKSVLDVGCGLGIWLDVARSMGAADIRGIEGNWLDRSKLVIDSDLVEMIDLEKPFSQNRKFDLVICLEVAEHLSPAAADGFIESLAAHADVVLFSAAIPHQRGRHHVNEQFPDYWAERFARHGFRWIELFRPTIWNDKSILWWLRQNTILFAHDRMLAANEKLRELQQISHVLSKVHPDVYLSRIELLRRALGERQDLMDVLMQGGKFEIKPGPNNTLTITKL